MSGARIPARLRTEVERRAAGRCEYCLVPDGAGWWPHETDHILAEQHGGRTALENLAFACFHCNRYKGHNLASLDQETGRLVPLFNPRVHRWGEHFQARAARIIPLTDLGRLTVALLRFNSPERLRVRQALLAAARWRMA